MEQQSDQLFIILFSVLVPVVITLIVLLLVRKYYPKNKVSKLRTIKLKSIVCPDCGEKMDKGFSSSPRGIVWRPKNSKPFGMGAMHKIEPNTFDMFAVRASENRAWKCKKCGYLLVDTSEMLKIDKHTTIQ